MSSNVIIPMPISEAKALELAKQNKPSRAMPKWSAARRARFMRTVNRKTKERLARERAARQEERKGRKGSRGIPPIGRPRPAYAGRKAPREALPGSIGPHTGPQEGRKGRQVGEERLDAIAYLRAAVEGYEGIPTSVCLSLLALRRLLGQIK